MLRGWEGGASCLTLDLGPQAFDLALEFRDFPLELIDSRGVPISRTRSLMVSSSATISRTRLRQPG